jgi:competence ComEA-like helix-hairpin-helix protein
MTDRSLGKPERVSSAHSGSSTYGPPRLQGAPAGPARRTRQDRPEVDRRRPVPARRLRAEAWPLDAVIEDCVNAVGVDVNTASAKLLARVSGVGEALAQTIVLHRETHGAFTTRAALKDVPRLGPKAFELSAGFLRIADGDQPFDRSGVHPEAYPIVRRFLEKLKADIHAVIGNPKALRD